MRLLRQKLYSKTSKKEKEKESKALANSSVVAASGTGAAFLGKRLLDKRANRLYEKEVESAKEEMNKIKEDALKKFEESVSKKREEHLEAIKSNEAYFRERGKSEDRIKAATERLKKELDESLNRHIKQQEFLQECATDKANKDYSKKSIELLDKKSKRLLKNKKIKKAALIGTGIATVGTYGITKYKENKKKKNSEKQFSKKEKEKKSKAEKALQGASVASGAGTLGALGIMGANRIRLAGEHKTKESMDKAIQVAKEESKELKRLSDKYIDRLTKEAENSKNLERLKEAINTVERKANLEAKMGNSAHKYLKSSKAAKIGVGATAGLAVAASGAKYLRRRKENGNKKEN